MKQKTKVTITKIILFISLGMIGYYIMKHIYLWYRKKKNIKTEPNLSCMLLCVLAFHSFDIFFLLCIIFG